MLSKTEAHRYRHQAAEASWKFALWARARAAQSGLKYDRAVAARALRAARLTATVCLPVGEAVASYRGAWAGGGARWPSRRNLEAASGGAL